MVVYLEFRRESGRADGDEKGKKDIDIGLALDVYLESVLNTRQGCSLTE